MSKLDEVMVPDLCLVHQTLLVHQARYSRADPWRALLIIANVALFQAATCDAKIQSESGGDIGYFGRLGCLACRKPDAFGEIVEAAKSHDLGAIKALGESWVTIAAAARRE